MEKSTSHFLRNPKTPQRKDFAAKGHEGHDCKAASGVAEMGKSRPALHFKPHFKPHWLAAGSSVNTKHQS
jgi:hypothetical protein